MKVKRLCAVHAIISVVLFLGVANHAFCLPQIGDVAEGEVVIQYPDAHTMEIVASTEKTVINYSFFKIADGESLIITLPANDSEIVNNLLGDSRNEIFGTVSCNGKLTLVGHTLTVGYSAQIMAEDLELRFESVEYVPGEDPDPPPPYGELRVKQNVASVILLCTGDEDIPFTNDVAITAFTMAVYDNGVFQQTLEIGNIEYEEVDVGTLYPMYRIAHFTIVDPAQQGLSQTPSPAESMSSYVPGTVTSGSGGIIIDDGNIPIIDIGSGIPLPPMTGLNNSIYNVVVGVFQGSRWHQPLLHDTQIPIGIVYPFPQWGGIDRVIKIRNVVVSDITTGEVITVIETVEPGQANTGILGKLDAIQQDMTKLDTIEKGIKKNKRLLQRNRSFLGKIYHMLRWLVKRHKE